MEFEALREPLQVQLQPGRPALLCVDTGDPAGWALEHRDPLHALLLAHGSVLVRGLGLHTSAQTAAVFGCLARSGLMAERESFASRHAHGDGVYAATKWPSGQQMCMHNELSYVLEAPGLMMFACLTAPERGGATPTADAEAVLAALPAQLVTRFERTGWLLTRNYTEDIGLPYPEVFGTDDREAVQQYCRSNAIEFEWQPDGGLRTKQRRRAVLTHPVTGRACWFNQIAFMNEWTLAPEVREFLVDLYGPDGLPFNTSFGDGTAITEDIVALLNETYEAHTVRTAWQDGDLLLVDNVRTAHGREPFEGAREIVVALADPIRSGPWPATVTTVSR